MPTILPRLPVARSTGDVKTRHGSAATTAECLGRKGPLTLRVAYC